MKTAYNAFACSLRTLFVLLLGSHFAAADGPADNNPATVRRIPKQGIEVPAENAKELQQGLANLERLIEPLRKKPEAAPYLPDVLVFHKAVHDALAYEEFFDAKEFAVALELLEEGRLRAAALSQGQTPWLQKSGPVVRGYLSKIDGSVQPYGLVIPASLNRKSPRKHRLDLWFHGRGENLSELNFVNDRHRNPGQFTPDDTIVLHPYGRYCNANKFAGEIDTFEALEAAQKDFNIDENRIAVRGFSMGGAACWQFAVHYPDRWFAAAPGAGFSETPDFLKVFQKEELNPTWYERKLWHWYDCTDYALNLAHLPTVAYSGEQDRQKQAADVMATALAKERIELVHIIGPATEHSYHPAAKVEIDRRIDALAQFGRDRSPRHLRLVTYTLRYNRMHWLTITGLQQHWAKTQIEADINDVRLEVTSKNVSAFSIQFETGRAPIMPSRKVMVQIDGERFPVASPRSDRSWDLHFAKTEGKWSLVPEAPQSKAIALVKSPGLQGPIDDAFLDSFIFVRPTGKASSSKLSQWSEAELARAMEHWRRHFRGEARVKNDTEITADDIASANLVLWGDPASNKFLGEIAEQLPIQWNAEKITVGDREFAGADHALIAIYPNPKNLARYVVLNSSFTFRDFAYLNNARQVAKLPDWAIVNLNTPPDSLWPGKIVDADFFDEHWQVQESPERKR